MEAAAYNNDLPDMTSLSHYVGCTVSKYFPGHGQFRGTVASLVLDELWRPLFHVVYEDNDEEDLYWQELQEILVASAPAPEVGTEQAADSKPRSRPKRSRERDFTQKRRTDKKSRNEQARSRSLPPIPMLSEALNEDVTELILGFLDPSSYCAVTKLTKAFYAGLIPRQKFVWVGSFKSFDRFMKIDFAGIEFFSARDCNLVSNTRLNLVIQKYPKLSGVDLTNSMHKDLNDVGLRELLRIGRHLTTFVNTGRKMATDTDVKTIAQFPNLQSLSLSIGRGKGGNITEHGLKPLENMQTLRKLRLHFSSRTWVRLPESLPMLEKLYINVQQDQALDWSSAQETNYPNLKELWISDFVNFRTGNPTRRRPRKLSASYLIDMISTSCHFQKLIIAAVDKGSTLHRGEYMDEEEYLFQYLDDNDIEYCGPARLTASSGAEFDVDFSAQSHPRTFVNHGSWIHKKSNDRIWNAQRIRSRYIPDFITR